MSVEDRLPADVLSFLERPITRRRALAFMGLSATAAALAACGASTSATTAPTAAGTAAPTAAGTAAPTAAVTAAPTAAGPAKGGTVTIGVQDSIGADLDPRSGTDNAAFFVKAQVFQTLLQLDPKTGTITPGLAAALPTQIDELTWEMKLRPGVIWHDGSAVTAKDVKYTMGKVNDKEFNSLFINTYNFVASVEVIDDTTMRFKLARPFGAFLDRMTGFAPVPEAIAEKMGRDEYKRKPVGNGPWMISDVVPEQALTLKPFDKWAGEKPKLDTVIWKRFPDGAARITALQTSAIDITISVPPDIFPILGTGGVVTGTVPATSYDAVAFNCGKPPFDNKLVRQAFAHAINRDELMQVAWGGRATAAWGPLPPWHWATNSNGNKLEYDPEKAKALLAQAGVTLPLQFELLGQNAGPQLLMVTTIQAQLQKVGFAPTLKLADGDSAYAFVDDKSFQAFNFYGDTGLLGLDPDIWYRWLQYGTFFNNSTEAENKKFQVAIDAAAAIGADKKDERLKAYWALQDLLAEEQRILHIDGRNVFNAWRDNIAGFQPTYNNVPNMSVVSKG